jgi:hypothetical protein
MALLERIRTKPSQVKTQIALAGAFSLTFVVALVWMTTVPARLGDMKAVVATEGSGETANVIEGFDTFLEQMGTRVQGEGTNEATNPTAPDTTSDNYSNTALDSLGTWNEQPVGEALPPTTTPLGTTNENPPTTPQNNPGEASFGTTTVTNPAPKPTVILIGTTTKNPE